MGAGVIMEWGYGRWTGKNRARFGSSNVCEAVEIEGNYATMRNTRVCNQKRFQGRKPRKCRPEPGT